MLLSWRDCVCLCVKCKKKEASFIDVAIKKKTGQVRGTIKSYSFAFEITHTLTHTFNSLLCLLLPHRAYKKIRKCGEIKGSDEAGWWVKSEWVLIESERSEERGERWNWHSWEGAGCAGFVNKLVCMAGTTQWPRARNWHAVDTRLKLTLTPQIITFSLWKLALPSHSSHSVSASLFSPALFLFLISPHLLSCIGGRMVLTLKSNYLSFTCLSLPLIINFKWKVK